MSWTLGEAPGAPLPQMRASTQQGASDTIRTRSRRQTHSKLGRPRRALITTAIVAGLVVVVAPPIALVAGALGAAVVGVPSLVGALQRLLGGQVEQLPPYLATLDAATRVILVAAGFFALTYALVALFGGIAARGWRRLYLAPGLLLTVATMFCTAFAMRLLFDAAMWQGIPPAVSLPLTGYVVADAIALAALLTDTRTGGSEIGRIGRMAHRRRDTSRALPAPALPLVRFAPSAPLDPVAPASPVSLDAHDTGAGATSDAISFAETVMLPVVTPAPSAARAVTPATPAPAEPLVDEQLPEQAS